jgi:DNA-binding transcriptional ArsR family regulator
MHDSWNALKVSRGHDVDLAHLSSEAASEVAGTMQALATSSRVRILSRLTAGPCSVKELARAVEMEQPAVSQQLRVLRDLGLVIGKRQGRKTIYKLHDKHVGVLIAEAVAHTQHRRTAAVKVNAHSTTDV